MKQEIMIRMGLALLALFVFGKILAPGIGMWIWERLFNPPRKNRRDFDFDQLVENKKNILQQTGSIAQKTKAPVHPAPVAQKTCPTKQKYSEELAKISRQSPQNAATKSRQKSLESLTELFDALQWGDGEEINSLARQISHQLGLRVESKDVVRVIKVTLKRRWILSLRSSSLPGFKQLLILWECYLFWEWLLRELADKGGPLSNKLLRRFQISLPDLQKAVISLFAKLQKRKVSARDILENKVDLPSLSQLDGLATRLLFSEDTRAFRPKKEWISRLSREALFFSSLSPLPPLKNDRDEEGARKVLGVSDQASAKDIKKAYKKWALLKHPDKLSARGIPSEFERIATENFALIQRAYQILKVS